MAESGDDSDLSLYEATKQAIAAATHLADARFLGSKAALLALARKVDAWDVVVRWAVEDAAATTGTRPTVPQNDNVSISAYAKLSEQMGLTPSGQKALEQVPRTSNVPERATAKGGDADGRSADQGGKTARLADIRSRRSVPRSG